MAASSRSCYVCPTFGLTYICPHLGLLLNQIAISSHIHLKIHQHQHSSFLPIYKQWDKIYHAKFFVSYPHSFNYRHLDKHNITNIIYNLKLVVVRRILLKLVVVRRPRDQITRLDGPLKNWTAHTWRPCICVWGSYEIRILCKSIISLNHLILFHCFCKTLHEEQMLPCVTLFS